MVRTSIVPRLLAALALVAPVLVASSPARADEPPPPPPPMPWPAEGTAPAGPTLDGAPTGGDVTISCSGSGLLTQPVGSPYVTEWTRF